MIVEKEQWVFATRQVENNKYLRISLYRHKGHWIASWTEYIKEGMFERVEVCNPRNRAFSVYEKRYSKKDLLKLNTMLESKIDEYYGKWLRQNYDVLAFDIKLDVVRTIGKQK